MKIGLGVLTYDRPIHTALTLAHALFNKSQDTDVHVYYSFHRTAKPKSKCLDDMLKALQDNDLVTMHYLLDGDVQNTGSNVDNLIRGLTAVQKYEAIIKIDDDVLIGDKTDNLLASLLMQMEDDNVMILAGQAVWQHMRGPNAFAWERVVDGYKIAQRSGGCSPMETFTAINPKMLKFLQLSGYRPFCEDGKGTYGPFSHRLTAGGGRAAVVLTPAIQMQHIGLCSAIEQGAARDWAPATRWDPRGEVIQLPYFDFSAWEAAHKNSTQKEYALGVLDAMKTNAYGTPCLAIGILSDILATYATDGTDVALPKDRDKPLIVRTNPDPSLRMNGAIINRPPKIQRRLTVVNGKVK